MAVAIHNYVVLIRSYELVIMYCIVNIIQENAEKLKTMEVFKKYLQDKGMYVLI